MTVPTRAVFLSYASQDCEAAQRICEALRAAGIEVWFDQSELRGGDAWDQKIRRQIRDCALFVPLISANTASRHEGYFRLEWDLADQRTHMIARDRAFIVPVCVDGTPDSGTDVPESFVRVQWTRVPAGATPPGFVQRLSTLLSPGAHVAAAPPQLPAGAASRPLASRRLQPALLLIATVVLIGVAYLAADKFVLSKRVTRTGQASAQTAQGSASVQSAAPEKSIAVLPFVDMSEKHDQEYFSDGLSEELIDLLSRTPDLRVIARTSSFQFKGRNEDVRSVARQLGVANLLEGSVRKAGTTIRVTVQLIKAADGSHLWSETYDRRLDDIFKVQDDICGTVVKALRLALIPVERTKSLPQSIDAYNAMLRGKYFEERFTKEDTGKAIMLLQEAIRLDPGYAQAWVELAETYLVGLDNSWTGVSEQAGYAQVRSAAERALQLDPNVPRAHGILGGILVWADYNWAGAQAQYALDPYSPATQVQLAEIAVAMGRLDDSIDLLRQVLLRDPLSTEANYSLAVRLLDAGRAAEAESQLRKLLEIRPLAARTHYGLALTFLARGRYPEAFEEMQHETDYAWRTAGLPLAYWAVGRRAEADAALETVKEQYADTGSFQIAESYAYRGDKGLAFAWLDRAYRLRDPGLFRLKTDFLFKHLRSDPRYKGLLRKMNLSE
jgi:TolB-like protein/cytochrome c-type biogenesis protein CcmH/NrfG